MLAGTNVRLEAMVVVGDAGWYTCEARNHGGRR